MNTRVTRRRWLQACGTAAGAGWLPITAFGAQMGAPSNVKETPGLPKGFPQQSPDLVRETVGASHRDLARVRELVTAYPELAKCSWDWGFGDWESPLGAASHTGRREIAMFLIEHGARPDLFTFAMLGELEVVKAVLAAHPEQIETPGPHGLTLLHHARAGGDEAKAVFAYLTERGAPDNESSPPPQNVVDALVGQFKDLSRDLTIDIETNRFGLALRSNGSTSIRLTKLPDGSWHPAGAPSVRLRFEPADGKAEAVTLAIGTQTFRAVRS